MRHKYLGETTTVAGSRRVYGLLSRRLVLLIAGFLSPRILKQFVNGSFNQGGEILAKWNRIENSARYYISIPIERLYLAKRGLVYITATSSTNRPRKRAKERENVGSCFGLYYLVLIL